MPLVRMPDGTAMHVKMAAPRRRRCVACSELVADAQCRLCDARIKGKPGKTCSKPVCQWCVKHPQPGIDLCPHHMAQYEALQKAKGPGV